jgi:hypothetical protein
MERRLDTMETTIPHGRILRIDDSKGLELRVVTGCVWITQDHDTSDLVLGATDTFRVSRDGRTRVYALKEARLRIACPIEGDIPGLTLGGGYREFGASVARAVLAEWVQGFRDWIVAGVHTRVVRTGRFGMTPR